MKKPLLFYLLTALMLLAACKKEQPVVPASAGEPLVLHLLHFVDSVPLQQHALMYENVAGNPYSVSKLNYLISEITLEYEDGSSRYLRGPWYIDPFDALPDTIQLPQNNDAGYPLQLSFHLGLDSALNQSGLWDVQEEIMLMAWPEIMGGGYHFLKFEGQFLTGNSQLSGFAFHLGKSRHLVRHLPVTPSPAGSDSRYELRMQLNRWFGPPVIWDLNQQLTHTMHNDSAMQMLAQNGQYVFNH